MPLVKGDPDDARSSPPAASATRASCSPARPLIMSVFLLTSSVVTTLLIPHEEFEEGGEA